jgi:hypothetical protein
MSKKILRINESELVNLLKKVISEQNDIMTVADIQRAGKPTIPKETPSQRDRALKSNYGNSVGLGVEMGQRRIQNPVTMDGSLFLNGVDKIDTNSEAFKTGIQSIQNALKNSGNKELTVDVKGGASRVGEKEGYDNEGLAKRRAQNFINAASKLFPSVKFNKPTFKVGQSTEKNSPQANSEQFVKLSYLGPEIVSPIVGPAVDNTQLVMRYVKDIPKIDPEAIRTTRLIKVCYYVPETMLTSYESFAKKLGGRTA